MRALKAFLLAALVWLAAVPAPAATPITFGAASARAYGFGLGVGRDPFFSSVATLLHGTGTNGSTTFTDSSSHALTYTGNGSAQISTAQSKFGGGSISIPSAGGPNYLSGPASSLFAFGAGDYTIEAWYYAPSLSGVFQTIWTDRSGSGANAVWLGINASNQLSFFYGSGISISDSASISTGQWYFFAATRTGGTIRLFKNGTLVASVSDSTNVTNQNSFLGYDFASSANQMGGFLNELRITKGVARYTSSFTPPVAPFPNH